MEEPGKKKIRTSTFLRKLFKAPNLNRFMEENEEYMKVLPFPLYLSELCRKTGCIPEQIIKKTTIERTYGHQIFNGIRKPSRDKVLQLALGFGLDVTDTQKLISAAQKSPLYPRLKRDSAILYCIEHHLSDMETQNVLQELGLTLLGGQKDG